MTAVKLETNLASFPKVGHDGAPALRSYMTSAKIALSWARPPRNIWPNLVPKHLTIGFPRHYAGTMILIHPAKGQHWVAIQAGPAHGLLGPLEHADGFFVKMNQIDQNLMSNSRMTVAMLLMGFPSKNASRRDFFGRDGKRCLPLIVANDASCGIEALDTPFEGVLVRYCMMIWKVVPADKKVTQRRSTSSAGMLDYPNFFIFGKRAVTPPTSQGGWFHHDRKKSIKTVKIVTRLTNMGAYKMAGSFLSNVLLRMTVRLPCATL